ncbi:hypothetical protein D3C85_1656130 [compost metagenome]
MRELHAAEPEVDDGECKEHTVGAKRRGSNPQRKFPGSVDDAVVLDIQGSHEQGFQ